MYLAVSLGGLLYDCGVQNSDLDTGVLSVYFHSWVVVSEYTAPSFKNKVPLHPLVALLGGEILVMSEIMLVCWYPTSQLSGSSVTDSLCVLTR